MTAPHHFTEVTVYTIEDATGRRVWRYRWPVYVEGGELHFRWPIEADPPARVRRTLHQARYPSATDNAEFVTEQPILMEHDAAFWYGYRIEHIVKRPR